MTLHGLRHRGLAAAAADALEAADPGPSDAVAGRLARDLLRSAWARDAITLSSMEAARRYLRGLPIPVQAVADRMEGDALALEAHAAACRSAAAAILGGG